MATSTITYNSATDTSALTITLASLATSATWVAGRESTAVSNTTNLFVDALLTGQIMVGTTPTANTVIEIWGYAANKIVSSTVTYPDVMDGTDSAETLTNRQAISGLVLLDAISVVATTSDVGYTFGPISLAAAFGNMPTHWGVFVTHNTGVNLNATGSNHWIHYQGIKYASA